MRFRASSGWADGTDLASARNGEKGEKENFDFWVVDLRVMDT